MASRRNALSIQRRQRVSKQRGQGNSKLRARGCRTAISDLIEHVTGKRPQGIKKEGIPQVRSSTRISRLQEIWDRRIEQRHSSRSTKEACNAFLFLVYYLKLTSRVTESLASSTIKGPQATPSGGTSSEAYTNRAASKTLTIFACTPSSWADSRSRNCQWHHCISEKPYQ